MGEGVDVNMLRRSISISTKVKEEKLIRAIPFQVQACLGWMTLGQPDPTAKRVSPAIRMSVLASIATVPSSAAVEEYRALSDRRAVEISKEVKQNIKSQHTAGERKTFKLRTDTRTQPHARSMNG